MRPSYLNGECDHNKLRFLASELLPPVDARGRPFQLSHQKLCAEDVPKLELLTPGPDAFLKKAFTRHFVVCSVKPKLGAACEMTINCAILFRVHPKFNANTHPAIGLASDQFAQNTRVFT